jgi:hypothetical protein
MLDIPDVIDICGGDTVCVNFEAGTKVLFKQHISGFRVLQQTSNKCFENMAAHFRSMTRETKRWRCLIF